MRKAAAHPNQFGFTFEPPAPAIEPASLAGLEARAARSVGAMLKHDIRSREVIAAEMSVLLDEPVSTHMLDAYASPMRDGHKVILSRFLALVAVTARFDVLDRLVREVGAGVLDVDGLLTAEIGQIDVQMAQLAERKRRRLKSRALIGEGKTG